MGKRVIRTAYDAYWFIHNHPKLRLMARTELTPQEARRARRKHLRVVRDEGGNYWREWRHLFENAITSNLDIHFTKTNERGTIVKDKTRNIRVACWLELGPVEYMYCQPEFEAKKDHRRAYKMPTHDIDLDVGGPTFDSALIKMARKVLKHYGNYQDECVIEGKCGKPCGDCLSMKKFARSPHEPAPEKIKTTKGDSMKCEIKSRWNGSVLFSLETESIKLAVEAAYKSGADLTDADLRDADLRDADLTGADLRGADLRGAVLTGADLTGADLRGADLRDADLTGADLRGADLTGADLTGADLRGAVLTGADLTGADLRGADLTPVRDDLWAVLSASPAEVSGLRAAIAEGRINGSTYEGACACLVGTLANARHCQYNQIPGLSPNSSRPAEVFFLNIKTGDTPETSPFSKLALEWTDLWLTNMRTAFGQAPR